MQPTRPIRFTDQADDEITARVYELLRKKPRVIIAIDGNCSAGKTTAAAKLGALLHANVFHMDDYFLQPHMRTPERLAQPGGNVDAERFLRDILLPVSTGKPAYVEPYDCHLDRLLSPEQVAPRAVSIVEGAYSLHPVLAPYYDIKIFFRIAPALQMERIRARNGERMLELFRSRWIPLENTYFSTLDIERSCDISVHSTQKF
jgi:uridine kinase